MDDDPQFSRPLSGFCWSEHEVVNLCISDLYSQLDKWAREVGGRKRLDKKSCVQHLKHFTLEAFKAYKTHPDLYLAIPRRKSAFTNPQKPRSHYFHLSYPHSKLVCDFLLHMYLFELYGGDRMGWFDSSTGKGFRTRMRATGALIARMEGYGINRYMITDYPYKPPEVIILRASKEGGKKKGKEIDYKDTENTICMRDKVNAINTYLRSQCLNLLLKDKDLRDLEERMYAHTEDQGGGEFNYLDFTDTSLRRIFNNGDFQQGGRFYGGWWQSIPSEYRNLITINGKKTVEIDYSGMHFAIMYAQIDLEVPMEDPYELPGIDPKHRKQIKKAFNALINCRTTKEATVLVNTKIETGEWSKELGNGEFLFNAFTEIHEPISGMIASGHGLKAQFYDSEVAERVMLRGIEDGICILPVHDSFIVRAGEENALKDYMKESFRDVLGQTPDLGLVELKGLHHHRSSDPIKAWGADKQGQEKELTGDDDLEGLISFGELVGVGEGMSVDDVIGYQQYELREEECRKAKEL